jgi:hypothetical protein
MKETAKAGYVSGTRKAQCISADYEDRLWASDTLGSWSLTQLLNTIVYLIGLDFCLRGGEELRRLRFGDFSQIVKGVDTSGKSCLIYTEDVSKTKHKDHWPATKKVYAYHNSDNHQ